MATRVDRLPDWDAGAIDDPLYKRLALFVALLAPILVVSFLAAFLGGTPLLGTGVFFLLTFLIALAAMWRADARGPLRSLKPKTLDDERFQNIAEGIAERIGVARPRLLEVDGAGPNAMVFGIRRPTIVVTRQLLEEFTRTEQEAVAAHCLLRIRSGRLWLTHVSEMLGRTGSRFAPRIGELDDVHAAALTRYPPALASAISKSKPDDSATAPFWFVGYGESHRHPAERVAELKDL